MPGFGGFEVTLTDLLMARSAPLTEEELWAILAVSCECLDNQMKRDRSTWASGPSLLITMDTLMLNRAGEVRFCPGFLAPDDPGSHAPPEAVTEKYEVTKASIEKMYMYSLAMSLFTAAEFERDEGLTLGDDLESVLLSMCEETPESRFSVRQVQETCSEHATKSNCLPYSEKISAMIESLIGSTAVLDNIGSMDDLDLEDASLEQEIAEALQKRTASMASVRTASPLGSQRGLPAHLRESSGSMRSSPRTPLLVGATEAEANRRQSQPRELPSPPKLTDKHSHIETTPPKETKTVTPPKERSLKLEQVPVSQREESPPSSPPPSPPEELLPPEEPPPPPPPESDPPPVPDSPYPEDEPTESLVVVETLPEEHKDPGYIINARMQSDEPNTRTSPVFSGRMAAANREESTPKSGTQPILSKLLLHSSSTFSGFVAIDTSQAQRDVSADAKAERDDKVDVSPPLAQSTPARGEKKGDWASFQADLAMEAAATAANRGLSSVAEEEEEGIDGREADRRSKSSSEGEGGGGWTEGPVVTMTMEISGDEGGEMGTLDSTRGTTYEMSTETEQSTMQEVVLIHEDSRDSATKSTKKRRWGRGKKEPPPLGTIYGDEWPSVKREKSAKKLKTMFGPEFTKIHGDWKKPSVALVGSGETKIPAGRRLVSVALLDGSQLSLTAEVKSTVGELLNLVMTHLSLKERFFFGIAVKKDDEEMWFMDPLKKLRKYAPPSWKTQSSVPFQAYFCLKYYVDNLDIIKYTQTLHLMYLQMKRDVIHSQMYCHEDSALILASYALQADYGDCEAENTSYFNASVYVRPQVIEKLTEEYVKELLFKMHRQHRGLNQAQAQMEFVLEMQRLSEYGLAFYKVKSGKEDAEENTVLGVGVRGLVVFEMSGNEAKTPVKKFSWQQTHWITFKEKRFTLIPLKDKVKLHYHTSHYRKARYLLRFCQELHKFQVLMSKRIAAEKEFAEGKGPEINDSDSDDDTKSHQSLLLTAISSSPPAKRRAEVKKTASSELPAREVKIIKLIKSEGHGLGMLIAGGYMPKTGEDYGIYVKSMTPDGAAGIDGRIQPGDKILQVNGRPLDGLSHAEVVDLMKESPPLIELVISHKVSLARASVEKEAKSSSPPASPQVAQPSSEVVVLTAHLTRSNGSLGISVIGGINSRQLNGAVFVQSVARGGAAEVEGTIRPGDRLVRVNGRSLVGLDHVQVVQQLKDAGDEVDIEIERTVTSSGDKRPASLGAKYDSLTADGEVIAIELDKDEYGLGFSLSGGADVGRMVSIKKIFKDGVASRDGRLREGDILREVNGKRMESLKHSEVVACLRAASTPVRLVVVRPKELVAPVTPQIPSRSGGAILEIDGKARPASMGTVEVAQKMMATEFQSSTPPRADSRLSSTEAELVEVFGEQTLGHIFGVELQRGVKGFGFSVTSGAKSGVDDSIIRGCFVRVILADPALSDGRLQPGDQILSVNGVSLKGVPHSEAVNMLRCMDGQRIRMTLVRRKPQATVAPAANETIKYETPSPTSSPQTGDMPPIPPTPNPWYDKTLFIDLQKEGQELGFSLYTMPNWGTTESGQTFDCVYVKRIEAGSLAGRDGRLRVNDRLLEVDREKVEGRPYYEVINTLRRTRGKVVLKIARSTQFTDEGEEKVTKMDDVPSTRIMMSLKSRRPMTSPGKSRRHIAVKEPGNFARPEVPAISVDEPDGESPAPTADSFGTPRRLSLRDNRVVYREDHLGDVCHNIENRIHAINDEDEFSQLRNERSGLATVGRSQENVGKNRFPNLVPFDHTRVKLSAEPGHSDYINASHVKVVTGSRLLRFICTQAPLKKTVDDFWQMVWEQKVSVIAMITNLSENGKEKCVRYWPKKPLSAMRVSHKSLEITLTSEHTFDHYVSRVLRIRHGRDENASSRIVVHFQFTDWPARGVPKDPSSMVEFVSAVRKAASGPDLTVVHCGAGIGRTGVHVVINSILCAVEEDVKVDIAELVQLLRESRPNMVQTKDQYLFCYKSYLNIVKSLYPQQVPNGNADDEEEIITM